MKYDMCADQSLPLLQECVKEWYKMCKENGISLSEVFFQQATLGDPVKVQDCQIAGLPVDK